MCVFRSSCGQGGGRRLVLWDVGGVEGEARACVRGGYDGCLLSSADSALHTFVRGGPCEHPEHQPPLKVNVASPRWRRIAPHTGKRRAGVVVGGRSLASPPDLPLRRSLALAATTCHPIVRLALLEWRCSLAVHLRLFVSRGALGWAAAAAAAALLLVLLAAATLAAAAAAAPAGLLF